MAFQTIRFTHISYAIIEILMFYAIYNNKKVIVIDLNNTFTNKNNVYFA